MRRFLLVAFLILLSIIIFSCSQAPQISPEWQPFWELSKIENQTSVQSKDFPDSVLITYLWEYSDTLTIDNIDLIEQVGGKTYQIENIDLERFGLLPNSSVLFLVDESGSMRLYYEKMDSLMINLMREIPADSFSVARFAANFVSMDKFYNQIEIVEEVKDFTQRANPDGTKLLQALYKAANMIEAHQTKQKAIILITDDSFSDERNYVKISSVIQYLKQKDINVIALSTGQFGHKLLGNLAYSTGGTYIYDVFDMWQENYLLSLIMHSYTAKYEPVMKRLDGQTHQIVINFDDFQVKRYGKYRVKGEMLPEYIEESLDEMAQLREQEEELQKQRQKQFEYPKILLMGLRVPFSDIGNKNLSNTAEDVLDSLITIVNDLPDRYAKGKFHIKGYTCNIGSPVFNKQLSMKRALTVEKYIRDRIDNSNFKFISNGFGENNPIRENTTEVNRKLNRRVEVDFIKPEILDSITIQE
ncbi:MAG: VWA domain-containing protein [Candidatus Zixiibacteriota bacterium]